MIVPDSVQTQLIRLRYPVLALLKRASERFQFLAAFRLASNKGDHCLLLRYGFTQGLGLFAEATDAFLQISRFQPQTNLLSVVSPQVRVRATNY